MLILSRKPLQSIVIGDDIRITIVAMGNGRVKVGIDAPPSVRVDREEVRKFIDAERKAVLA